MEPSSAPWDFFSTRILPYMVSGCQLAAHAERECRTLHQPYESVVHVGGNGRNAYLAYEMIREVKRDKNSLALAAISALLGISGLLSLMALHVAMYPLSQVLKRESHGMKMRTTSVEAHRLRLYRPV